MIALFWKMINLFLKIDNAIFTSFDYCTSTRYSKKNNRTEKNNNPEIGKFRNRGRAPHREIHNPAPPLP